MIIRDSNNKLVALNTQSMDIQCTFTYTKEGIIVNGYIGTTEIFSQKVLSKYHFDSAGIEEETQAILIANKWILFTDSAIRSMTFLT